MLFGLSSKQICVVVFHTKCMQQMDSSCRLITRCLKKDEPLEACYSSGCQNFIRQSCFKKVMSAVAESEWVLEKVKEKDVNQKEKTK